MRTIGKILAGAGILAASIASASAADLPDNSQPPVYGNDAPADYDYGVPAIGWTGFYLGGHLGSASNADDANADVVAAYGIHTGFNWQNSYRYVMGIEGEFTGLNAIDADALASVRGKLGYSFGRSMLYATAGVGFLDFEDLVGNDEIATGFAAGFGFDYKLTSAVSLGLDVSYYGFNDLDNGIDDDLDIVTSYARLTFHLDSGNRGSYK